MSHYVAPITRRNHGGGHSYRDANDQKIPGVTTLIKAGLPPKLEKWAAETTADHALDNWDELAELKPSERRKRLLQARFTDRDTAAARGTKIHRLAEKAAAGKPVELGEHSGHVEALVDWMNQWQPEYLHTEFTVVNYTVGYAGTADCVVYLPSLDQTWLIDYKTSRSGVFGDVALQLAAYRYAEYYLNGDTEKPMLTVDACGVVHIRADGADLYEVTAGPRQFRDFQYVVEVGRFSTESRELISEALRPPPLEEDVPA